MAPRVLIAGIGNIFLGDDGFGVQVVERLQRETVPEGVRVADFGIRGIHLAYELLDGGYETTVLVDATPRGGAPGTVYLIEPDLEQMEAAPDADAHSMNPESVFRLLKMLGGDPGRVLIVGCEPACCGEQMGLSEPVGQAIEEAVELIKRLTYVSRDSRPD